MQHSNRNKKGFTLVETLIALAIMSMLALTAISVITNISSQDKRSKIIAEVDSGASAMMYDIAQSVRNASAITSPLVGSTSSSTLSLQMTAVPSESPTIFTASSTSLSIAKASSTPYQLTNSKVLLTSLTFKNVTATTTKGAVRVSFTLSYYNPTNDPQLNYSTTLITTISLR